MILFKKFKKKICYKKDFIMNLLIRTAKKKNIKSKTICYNFKTKYTGVAGFCPDCDGVVTFNSYFQRYICLEPNCCFEADINKGRVWDNSMRDKFLKQEKENII